MLSILVWLVVAVALVTAVFLLASVMERGERLPGEPPTDGGLGGFWRSFRAGLRHPARRASGKPVDTDLAAFFADGAQEGPGYLDAEEITDVLARARQQATRQRHVDAGRLTQ
ncbi:hypothetical protein [Xylanimonas ulmi]|uniref:Uncharacterized protein n=1 Tax=Xylanimonas ulmi TaxID=228973 RepID=A0A4Q7M464_9MICO|nr:hypothetical protein [Xylanibacterium ulmi]RZS61422.1 hypothetical protein EV386_1721 [Xylanibacterium ulmi]